MKKKKEKESASSFSRVLLKPVNSEFNFGVKDKQEHTRGNEAYLMERLLSSGEDNPRRDELPRLHGRTNNKQMHI